ncbi:Glycosyltransferase sugar-binding region containing DXD motif-containing protein [Pedobacter terrae]|uniref:Glycosyltransferase sugar-binding region containing DXD motif-containing protein n=1 Tax=Pedobacter terrae TaxID=405671 RepID=A0A1G8CIN8_9SPHI|nr:glycosyltransferase [Pedobacter terrae]SDH45288.1 Glycosyltransferase sugar-binding region containing DXD motif-containing protein [Pedobacter terrae]
MEDREEILIPKIIHHIIGRRQNPLIEDCLDSWKCLGNYGFEIRIWTDLTIMDFISTFHPFAFYAFVHAKNHAEAADIARYLIIYTCGGYYVDWDVKLLSPEKFFFLSKRYLCGYMLVDPLNDTIASEYFCSSPKDPYLLNLVEDIVQLFNDGQKDLIRTPQYSGPYRMRDSLLKHPETSIESVNVKDIFAYDYREIRNPPAGEITQPLIHYWVHSWL